MKKFELKFLGLDYYVYIGEKEWDAYKFRLKEDNPDLELEDTAPKAKSGRTYKGIVWINNKADKRTMYHELSHLCDNVMETVHSNDTEFRAYVMEEIFDTVLSWL